MPSLIADGKIHQLEVNAKFDIPGGSELWSKSPQITTLRLDMVNEFPGTVDLYKVEFLKDDNIGRTVWDFAGDDETADWHVNRALTMKSTSDGLLLTVKGADSGIENNRLQIDPKHIGLIRITYQASGFNGKPTSGEVFFAGKPDNNYNGNKYFQVPSLTADGKVHTVTLDASKHIANGEGYWTEMQEINSLRLDMVNEFPGEIIIRKIEMLPALPKVINSVGELNVKQGCYYQNHDGNFALTLPAGEDVIHLHGSADHEVNNTLRNIKGFSPADTVCDPAREWNKAGTLKLDQVQKIAFTLPMDTVGLLIQPAATAVDPVRQKSGIPNSVQVKLGAKATAARHIVFDENMPYWKS